MSVEKVVILAGGLGSRLSEETETRPKPMVEIGERPIIWHIMKIYSTFGLNDFVICLGYKGYMIKEFFSNYHLHMADVTFDLANNSCSIHHKRAESWRVTLVDTSANDQVGGVRVHSQLIAAQTGSLVGMGEWTDEASHVGQPRRQEGNVCPERPASHDEEGVLLGDIGGRRDETRAAEIVETRARFDCSRR